MLKHHDDFSSYHYGMDCNFLEVKNIGWLHRDYSFKTGKVSLVFLQKLKELALRSDNSSCDVLVDRLRGNCTCPVCGKNDLKISNDYDFFLLGSAEIWIPILNTEGQYFATFGLIIHHIEEHQYQPPQEFIDSVLSLNLASNFNAQSAQEQLAEEYIMKKDKVSK